MAEHPVPDMPKVEFLEPDFARWTFFTDDPAVQRTQFNYWRGWCGFEEEDEPHSIEGRVWLVRRQRYTPQLNCPDLVGNWLHIRDHHITDR